MKKNIVLHGGALRNGLCNWFFSFQRLFLDYGTDTIPVLSKAQQCSLWTGGLSCPISCASLIILQCFGFSHQASRLCVWHSTVWISCKMMLRSTNSSSLSLLDHYLLVLGFFASSDFLLLPQCCPLDHNETFSASVTSCWKAVHTLNNKRQSWGLLLNFNSPVGWWQGISQWNLLALMLSRCPSA